MAITAQDVNKLRQMTGAGMMDCKKALQEADGDFDKAVDILRKQGQKVAAKRADNAVSEGTVVVAISADGTNGKLIAFACETEPVSNVEDFKDLAQSILDKAVADNIADKDALLSATLSDGRPVSEHIVDLVGKLGEKLEIVSYENVTADKVVPYIHSNGKLGVLVAFEGVNGTDVSELGKDVAMQIAAMKPIALDKDEVDSATVEREIEVGKNKQERKVSQKQCLRKLHKENCRSSTKTTLC